MWCSSAIKMNIKYLNFTYDFDVYIIRSEYAEAVSGRRGQSGTSVCADASKTFAERMLIAWNCALVWLWDFADFTCCSLL